MRTEIQLIESQLRDAYALAFGDIRSHGTTSREMERTIDGYERALELRGVDWRIIRKETAGTQ